MKYFNNCLKHETKVEITQQIKKENKLKTWPTDAGGGETPQMEGVGKLVGNFELHPLKETDLGVAQAFFDP